MIAWAQLVMNADYLKPMPWSKICLFSKLPRFSISEIGCNTTTNNKFAADKWQMHFILCLQALVHVWTSGYCFLNKKNMSLLLYVDLFEWGSTQVEEFDEGFKYLMQEECM